MCKKCPLREVEYMTIRNQVMSTRAIWGPQWLDADVSTYTLAEPRDIPIVCYSSEVQISVRVEQVSTYNQVIALLGRGMSARKVKSRFGLTMPIHHIDRLAREVYGPMRRGGNGATYAIGGNTFSLYVREALNQLGKDPYFCEICEEPQAKRCVIHHTKYAGATLYDLKYICQSCNLSRMNVGLV